MYVDRSDGRMAALASSEQAVLLASTQAALISTPECEAMDGNAPELLSVGHNPYPCKSTFDHSIVLPSDSRRKTLIEFLYERALLYRLRGEEAKGMKRKRRLQRLVQSWREAGVDDCLSHRSYGGRGDAVRGSGEMFPYGVHLLAADPNFCGFDDTNMTETNTSSKPLTADDFHWCANEFNPHKITAFMEGLSAEEQKVLAAQRFTEYFYESRVAALER